MMPKASLILSFLRSSRMGSGCGGMQGLICLLRFRVSCVLFRLVVRILLNGLFRNLVSSLAQILGMQFVSNTTKLSGGI
jgi:hypothetical protein